MYYSSENRTKLKNITVLIALSVCSVTLGRTLSNTLLLQHYSTSILPYFYFAQALLLFITAYFSAHYQTNHPILFTKVFKWIAIISLLLFSLALEIHWNAAPFMIAVLVLSITSIVPIIAWNYASDIFDIQEYKYFNKWLQSAGTLGILIVGLLVVVFSKRASSPVLLVSMSLIEFISLFCIRSLQKFVPPPHTKKLQLISDATLNKTPLYIEIFLIVMISFIVSILVDYNFKITLSEHIAKANITRIVTIVFVISTIITLLIQMFLYDFLFQKIGGKKIVFLLPSGLIIVALISFFHPSFIMICFVFITFEVLYFSVFSLTKNLYLNTLPSALNHLARLKLNGISKPLSIGVASLLSLLLNYLGGIQLSTALTIIFCLIMLYLGYILMGEYSKELIKSIQMHRFHQELITFKHENPKEVGYIFEEALHSKSIDTILFTLDILENDLQQPLPKSLKLLLKNKNETVVLQAIKLLLLHKNEPGFYEETLDLFAKTKQEKIRWHLALYLIEKEQNLLPFALKFEKEHPDNIALFAISSLIYLKQGDIDQQIKAMKNLTHMLHSKEEEQKIYFLLIMHELPSIRKEEYLMQFLQEDNPSIKNLALKNLALEQVSIMANKPFISSLINHLGIPSIAVFLNHILIRIGEPILDFIEKKFKETNSYLTKTSCIFVISQIKGFKAETSLIHLFENARYDNTLIINIAKSLAYRGVKYPIADQLSAFLAQQIQLEVNFFQQLRQLSLQFQNVSIQTEINSRIYLLKKRVLYYLIAMTGFVEFFGCLAPLLSSKASKNDQAIALELIDSKIKNRTLAPFMDILFTEIQDNTISQEVSVQNQDPWLKTFIDCMERNDMSSFYKLIQLRKTGLFNNIAAEALQAVAESCVMKDMSKDEIIFSEHDEGDGLYIIDVGEVLITKKGKILSKLGEGAYFGELALLVDVPRFATAKANSEGSLLYIDKFDFDTITDEMPEIMKGITTNIIHYFIDKDKGTG